MRLCGLILVLVTVFCAPVSSSELVTTDSTCPPWTYYRNNTCQCGSIEHGIIQCNASSATLTLKMCTCMTYDSNYSVAGMCAYSCIAHFPQPVYQLPMRELHRVNMWYVEKRWATLLKVYQRSWISTAYI